MLESVNGRIAVGWLVVEDLAMVLVLVLLPPLAGALGGTARRSATATLWLDARHARCCRSAAFVALMLVVGRRVFPWLLWQVARTGSRELFTLCVVAAAVGIAYGSAQLFGVSFALGAFFAGMVLRESEFSHRAAEESLPLRDAFAVLFFVSVGMLFDPAVLIEQPLQVLAVVAIIVLGKSLAACAAGAAAALSAEHRADGVARAWRRSASSRSSWPALGVSLGLLPAEGQSLILAGALISIALNPLVFAAIEPLQRWMRARSRSRASWSARDDPLAELPMTTDAKYLVEPGGAGRLRPRRARASPRR